MYRKLVILLITLSSFSSYSQISFEKGYYVDNSGHKTEVLVKNSDWKNIPTEFKVKQSDNSQQETLGIGFVKEFGIYNTSKYVRATVNIDRSGGNIDELSREKKPVFKQEQLFLKVLIEGKANLYVYTGKDLTRYFYKMDSSSIEQLIYKQFKTPDNKISENIAFKTQLWNDLKCSSISMTDVEKVNYKLTELLNLFVKYNQCIESPIVNFEQKQKRDFFNLTVRPGLNISSLSIHNSLVKKEDASFDKKLRFRLGVEAEFVLPFQKNKWAILLEPTYQSYKSESEDGDANYKSIELPLGLRYYFFLNNNSKIFINALGVYDFAINSTVMNLEIKSRPNFVFGFGYQMKEKFSVELRSGTSRDVLGDYVTWSSDYKTVSLIFGYKLF